MDQLEKQSPAWTITQEKIDDVVNRIVLHAKPTRIILFGSCGRGDNHIDSDVDILVIKRAVDDRYAELTELNRALRGVMLPVDLLLLDEGELNKWCNVPGSVYRTAVREGKVLYEAI